MTWSVEHVRVAKVQPDEVFRSYIDPSTWPRWGHNTRWARLEGPYVEGATVLVRAGYEKVWPVDGGAHLRHGIDVSGRFARFYGLFLPALYRRLLAKETRRLAEAITADRPVS